MKKVSFLNILVGVVLASTVALANPTVIYDSQPVEIFTVLDNFWWDGQSAISTQWQHLPINNPYPGGHAAYEQALADGLIEGVTLKVVTDDLDRGNSAHLWLQDKDGQWHYQDRNGSVMWLNTMAFSDNFGLQEGSGNGNDVVNAPGSHLTASVFDLDPQWLDGIAVNARVNWIANGGLNQMEVETAVLSVIAQQSMPVVPAPGAIFLASTGVGLVGWLHRRRKIC